MKIALKDLRNAFEKLAEEIEQSGFDEVEITDNLYWKIIPNEALDMTKTPELAVGSYIDDWNSLKKILSSENPTTSVDFGRVGNIIIIIGNTLHKELYKK